MEQLSRYRMSLAGPEQALGRKTTQQDDNRSQNFPYISPSAGNQQTLPKALRNQLQAECSSRPQQTLMMDCPTTTQSSTGTIRRIPIGGKDLIIRMLAEVFHVSYDNDGQVRWNQVSTSLVPVSLYSRTTGTWLDYLLNASSITASNDQSNAMSPDSRKFLLLMHQFHKGQTSGALCANNFAQHPHQQESLDVFAANHLQENIVFQIIGHDVIDGQCKKILNVKIVQPGTKLGQASDYFVYWKGQTTQLACNHNKVSNQFSQARQPSSSSYVTNNPMAQRQQVPANCQVDGRWLLVNSGTRDMQTWGLNFASTNDAKLFYDICSLNLVDLDFNSEYLKQLTNSDIFDYRCNSQVPITNQNHILSTVTKLNQQQRWRIQQDYQLQRKQQQQMISRGKARARKQQTMSELAGVHLDCNQQNESSYITKLSQARQSRPSCKKEIIPMNTSNEQESACPVHGNPNLDGALTGRSRSTTRAHRSVISNNEEAYPTRSFSTPASPEAKCPVHRNRTITDSEYNLNDSKTLLLTEIHQSSCKKRLPQSSYLDNIDRPMKPARGQYRKLDQPMDSYESEQRSRVRPNARHHHEVLTSDRALHSKQSARTRYQGYLRDQRWPEQATEHIFHDQHRTTTVDLMTSLSNEYQDGQTNASVDGILETKRRGARVARARYANSKNMTEFLSLDTSNTRTAPGHKYLSQKQNSTSRQKIQSSARAESQNMTLQRLDSSKSGRLYGSSSLNQPGGTRNKDRVNTNLESHGIDPDDNLTRNASTTTEDLPIDALARKRMLNLNSDEIISEQTEPKSHSSTNINAQIKQDEHSIPSGTQRQIRAVSLGPSTGQTLSARGRGVRSDVGRRRSLERSTCVDLDSSFPGDSFKKFTRLSPLPQSDSPMVPKVGDTNSINKAQDSKHVSSLEGATIQAQLDSTERRSNHQAQNYNRTSHSARGLSLAKSERFQSNDFPPKESQAFHSAAQENQAYLRNGLSGIKQMASFKSAPDISGLSDKRQQRNTDLNHLPSRSMFHPELDVDSFEKVLTKHSCKSNHIPQGIERGFQSYKRHAIQNSKPRTECMQHPLRSRKHCCEILNLSKRTANISSYEVPLCDTSIWDRQKYRHQPSSYGRQCYSCPNSLRRKRRALIYDNNSDSVDHREEKLSIRASSSMGVSASHVKPLRTNTCSYPGYIQAEDISPTNPIECAQIQDTGRSTKHCHARLVDAAGQRAASASNSYSQMGAVLNNFQQPNCSYFTEDLCDGAESEFSDQQHQIRRCRHDEDMCAVEYGDIGCKACSVLLSGTAPESEFTNEFNDQKDVPNGLIKNYCTCCFTHQQSIPRKTHTACVFSANHEARFGRSNRRLGQRPQGQCRLSRQEHSLKRTECTHRYPCQSLGANSRSPINYGLYESEWEDDDDDSNQDCGTDHSCSGHAVPRSASAHFRPLLQPVQGYDQTLSRSSLRLRHRSRSQPPSGNKDKLSQDESNTEEAAHLNKSMDNITKLIQEVQTELNSLRRYPLGTASINLKDSNPTKEINSKVLIEDQTISGTGNQHGLESKNIASCSKTSATRRAGQFKCVGAVRKAGFLSVKKWIVKRRQSIELARRQGWKRYWVCLRGTTLLFHSLIEKDESVIDSDLVTANNEEKANQIDLFSWLQANFPDQLLGSLIQNNESTYQSISSEKFSQCMSLCYIEHEPRHLIIIDGSIAQPIPEHPRRDFVFCLSTTFGDAYFFQAACQSESDNWITALHNACAASIARDLTRNETVKLFENKIRHLELEAEKKLFLRQRLESRLTTTLSMSGSAKQDSSQTFNHDTMQAGKKHVTLRSLLHQLSQQLLTLDTYIEQVHCEVYQLRCYLTSCLVQSTFGQAVMLSDSPSTNQQNQLKAADLPHPKSLLMHVSKPTKLLLLKLGVFTVSSFHAFIHARQDSARTILKRITQHQRQKQEINRASDDEEKGSDLKPDSSLELRIRSQSISEALMTSEANKNLEHETEELLEMANLRSLRLQISKELFVRLRCSKGKRSIENFLVEFETDTSDDRYSIKDGGDIVILNLKLGPDSCKSFIIKRVLTIIDSRLNELEFLDYYLRLELEQPKADDKQIDYNRGDEQEKNKPYIVKRKEKLNDWPTFKYAELHEKFVYRIEVIRCRTDEDASLPFGISIEGQLVSGEFDSALNVYCSYVEWGSSAERASLREDDELLMINGIFVRDLDLMFVEYLIKEADKLRLVVRSSSLIPPKRLTPLDGVTWHSEEGDDDDGDDGNQEGDDGNRRDVLGQNQRSGFSQKKDLGVRAELEAQMVRSQVISDEYLTSLVCPPPPAESDAFLRTNQNLIRQRSDLGPHRDSSCIDREKHGLFVTDSYEMLISKAKSQHQLDASPTIESSHHQTESNNSSSGLSCRLAEQLLERTERLTKLLVKNAQLVAEDLINSNDMETKNIRAELVQIETDVKSEATQNDFERLRQCLLELLETEYAYIKQLETIDEHYMVPLAESSFLDINDLKIFRRTLVDIIKFQREFFRLLATEISLGLNQTNLSTQDMKNIDDCEQFNRIIQILEGRITTQGLEKMVQVVARILNSQSEKFQVYANYSVTYSKIQRILHPKINNSSHFSSKSILSMPNSLNVFSSSTVPSFSGLVQQRDLIMRPMSSLIPNRGAGFLTGSTSNNSNGDHKQLTEFLNALDSSSSSLSISSSVTRPTTTITGTPLEKDLGNSKVDEKSYQTTECLKTDSSTGKGDQIQQQRYTHQQNFGSYLIKPIQRIVKYPMLLNSILIAVKAVFQDGDKQLYAGLKDAIRHMESIICRVNDMQRLHDEYGLVLKQIEYQYQQPQSQMRDQNRIDVLRTSTGTSLLQPIAHQPPIVLDLDQLLYFSQVDWLNMSDFNPKAKKLQSANLSQLLFVFSSCVVLICREIKGATKKTLLPMDSSDNLSQSSQLQLGQYLPNRSKQSKKGENDWVEIIRYQTLIPVSEVQVRSVASCDNHSDSSCRLYKWELFQCSPSKSNSGLLTNGKPVTAAKNKTSISTKNNSGRIYRLACHTSEDRGVFLRKIRITIRDSVRNMSLPLARTPSSRSYNSKKISSPTDLSSAQLCSIESSESSIGEDSKRYSKQQMNSSQHATRSGTTPTTNSSCASNSRSQTDSSCALGFCGKTREAVGTSTVFVADSLQKSSDCFV